MLVFREIRKIFDKAGNPNLDNELLQFIYKRGSATLIDIKQKFDILDAATIQERVKTLVDQGKLAISGYNSNLNYVIGSRIVPSENFILTAEGKQAVRRIYG